MCKNHLEAMESSKAEYNRVGEELKSKVETAEKKLVEVEVKLEEEQKQSKQYLEDNMQQKMPAPPPTGLLQKLTLRDPFTIQNIR